MSASKTVYLNLREMTEVQSQDVYVRDVGSVYCSDKTVQAKCAALKIRTIREKKEHRYVESALTVIRQMEALDPAIQVDNVGKVEFIIDYHPQKVPKPGLAVGEDHLCVHHLLLRRGLRHHDVQQ